jgi:lipoprotein signal peptidase
MTERSFRWLLWSLALFGLAADQASKYGMFAWLHGRPEQDYTFMVLRLDADKGTGFQFRAAFQPGPDGRDVPHVNQGALFGFLRDQQEAANIGFAVISLLAAVAILWWGSQRTTARDPWLCAALGLILAGTLGNLYDRLVFHGVRDFLHWNYLFDWPVFNVADCCLVLGAGLLLLQAFGGHRAPQTQPTEKPANARSVDARVSRAPVTRSEPAA